MRLVARHGGLTAGSAPTRTLSTDPHCRSRALASRLCPAPAASTPAAGSGSSSAVLLNRRLRTHHSHQHHPGAARGRGVGASITLTLSMISGKSGEDRPRYEETYSQMRVVDFMTTPVASLPPGASVIQAIKLMGVRGISGVPIVDEEMRVLGLVSGYDIICLEASPGRVSEYVDKDALFPEVGLCEKYYGGDLAEMWRGFESIKAVAQKSDAQTVVEIMHDACTIPDTSTVEDAANSFIYSKAQCACVVDESSQRLVGIISQRDVLKVALQSLENYMLTGSFDDGSQDVSIDEEFDEANNDYRHL